MTEMMFPDKMNPEFCDRDWNKAVCIYNKQQLVCKKPHDILSTCKKPSKAYQTMILLEENGHVYHFFEKCCEFAIERKHLQSKYYKIFVLPIIITKKLLFYFIFDHQI